MEKMNKIIWLFFGIVSFIIPASSCLGKDLSEIIPGTWIGISHQTIAVTHYREDGTYSGTYFTPAFDVKTTYSGKWLIEDKILSLNYEVSSSPIMKVPFIDRNEIEILNDNRLIFHTYPKGISVECNRVVFKQRSEVYKTNRVQSNTSEDKQDGGPNIYVEDDNDNRLISGVINNQIEEVEKALADGANINSREKINGNTPLILAAFYNHVQILQLLIGSGADIHAECNGKNTALMKAAWNGSIESVKELIKAGSAIDTKEVDGMTPLMVASFYGHLDVVELLVAANCSINEKDNEGLTALAYSEEQGHEKLSQFLMKHGAEK